MNKLNVRTDTVVTGGRKPLVAFVYYFRHKREPV